MPALLLYTAGEKLTIKGFERGKTMDAIDRARQFLSRDILMIVLNWGFDKGLHITNYEPVGDHFQFSDGEIYTTRQILKEVEQGD